MSTLILTASKPKQTEGVRAPLPERKKEIPNTPGKTSARPARSGVEQVRQAMVASYYVGPLND